MNIKEIIVTVVIILLIIYFCIMEAFVIILCLSLLLIIGLLFGRNLKKFSINILGMDAKIELRDKEIGSAKRDIQLIMIALDTPELIKKALNKPLMELEALGIKPKLVTKDIISKGDAISTAANLQDVINLKSRVKKLIYMCDGPEPYLNKNVENPVYVVRVAEDMGTHIATYDFITVDAKTGEIVKREFKDENGEQIKSI
ncbi:MAG: hypothetical protein ABII64_04295 [Elusimicrobiota bacterium]